MLRTVSTEIRHFADENRGVLRDPSLQPEPNNSAEIQRCAYEVCIQCGQEDSYALNDWLRVRLNFELGPTPPGRAISHSSRYYRRHLKAGAWERDSTRPRFLKC